MDKAKLQKNLRGLNISFIVIVMSLVAALATGKYPNMLLLFAGILGCATLCFYVFVAGIAKQLGKSRFLWVGLTLITNPFGQFVMFFYVRGKASSALADGN